MIIELNTFWIMTIVLLFLLTISILNIWKWHKTGNRIADTADNNTNKITEIANNNTNKWHEALDNSVKKWAETTNNIVEISSEPEDIKNNFKIINEFMYDIGSYINRESHKEGIASKILQELEELKSLKK